MALQLHDFMPVDEAERRYGLSRSTLFRWLREGKIKGYRKPRDRRTYVNGTDIRKLERYPLIFHVEEKALRPISPVKPIKPIKPIQPIRPIKPIKPIKPTKPKKGRN